MIPRPLTFAFLAFGFAVAVTASGAPTPDLRLRVVLDTGQPRLAWTSEARHRYDVEFATSAVGPWSVLARVTADATSAT